MDNLMQVIMLLGVAIMMRLLGIISHKSGYQEGYEKGFNEGYKEGLKKADREKNNEYV